jgi:hypothetical protein
LSGKIQLQIILELCLILIIQYGAELLVEVFRSDRAPLLGAERLDLREASCDSWPDPLEVPAKISPDTLLVLWDLYLRGCRASNCFPYLGWLFHFPWKMQRSPGCRFPSSPTMFPWGWTEANLHPLPKGREMFWMVPLMTSAMGFGGVNLAVKYFPASPDLLFRREHCLVLPQPTMMGMGCVWGAMEWMDHPFSWLQ